MTKPTPAQLTALKLAQRDPIRYYKGGWYSTPLHLGENQRTGRPAPLQRIHWNVTGMGGYAHAERAWSDSVAHGTGAAPKPHPHRHASQNGIALHSSELRAWKAARNEVEREAGDKLAAIDREIARLDDAGRAALAAAEET